MAPNYYTVEKAAEILGITPDEVKQLREQRELHGYRDGATWKFKAEDIERYAQQRDAAGSGDDDDDVLLSDVSLGGFGSSASGTVIGGESERSPGSDIELAEPAKKGRAPAKKPPVDELDLSLDDDLTLDDSTVTLPGKSKRAGDSDALRDVIDDDELVLGGSGSGSDIALGGDSGIQLVDPADSGLSLEEPLELSVSADESLELGEDDMISLAEEAGSEAVTKLKADDDFLLAPSDDTAEDDDESGSQVIALDSEPSPDQAATMIGSASTASMVAMLDEDLGGASMSPLAAVDGLGVATMAATGPAAVETVIVEVPLPEAPFGILSVLGLAACVAVLVLGGMMSFDLARNMWAWDGPYEFNSAVMDTILGMLEG